MCPAKYFTASILSGLLSLSFALGRTADSQERKHSEEGQRIAIGKPVVPLYGPWRFCIGDSPVDPATHVPVYAQPNFDDSAWEVMSLWPGRSEQSHGSAAADKVPGWTAKGHPGVWGFAWYRIRLNLETSPGENLALAGPTRIDDAYEVFANGKLLGSFGDFTRSRPVTYYDQPMLFRFQADPDGSDSSVQVIALRVWMDPSTTITTRDAGGLRSAPLIGEASSVDIQYQLRWHELIRSYSPFLIDAVAFLLLAVVALSLILFDREDRVYPWLGIVLVLSSACSALSALDVWTQHLSILEDSFIVQCVLGPLAYVGWFMVWRAWFALHRLRWLPKAAAGLATAYIVSNTIAIELFYPWISHQIALAFEVISVLARLLFFCLLAWIIIQGVRRVGREGWLVVPSVVLLAIAPFENELSFLHLSPAWTLFGTRFILPQAANLLLASSVALLLLRRLLYSVKRQRLIELDANRAQLQSDFVAAVSHEFRTPLTTLKSITDLLVQGRINDESRRMQSFVYLDNETTRLHRLVEDLLDFGRMESGRKQYTLSTFDAFQVVRAVAAETAEQTASRGFEIVTNLTACPATIRCDEEALRRAVRNLLDNAIKYSAQCRTVWIDGRVEGQRVSISIRDRGMGIDPAEHRAIFQKFVRGGAAKAESRGRESGWRWSCRYAKLWAAISTLKVRSASGVLLQSNFRW